LCAFSALMLLFGWQEGPVRNWVVGCWHGYLSVASCRFVYGPADPTTTLCLLLQEIQIGFGFTFPVLAPVNPDWFYQNGSAFSSAGLPGLSWKKGH